MSGEENRDNKRWIGGKYEQIAADYLMKQNIKIRERNFRCRQGEIDLIGTDGDILVFFEVKYRSNPKKGYPAEAITEGKQRRIRAAARYYLYRHGYTQACACRFDVVGILKDQIQWIKNAF